MIAEIPCYSGSAHRNLQLLANDVQTVQINRLARYNSGPGNIILWTAFIPVTKLSEGTVPVCAGRFPLHPRNPQR
jgi:hypothetical protein